MEDTTDTRGKAGLSDAPPSQGAAVKDTTISESEKHFREMADSAPMMVWVTDPNGYCTFLSESWYRFTGQKMEEGLGLGWVNAVHPEDRLKAKEAFTTANARRAVFGWSIGCGKRTGNIDGRWIRRRRDWDRREIFWGISAR